VIHSADTEIEHAADLICAGRPAVSLFGPTVPRRIVPWGQDRLVIHHPEACAASCPIVCWRRACLRSIEPDEVVRRAALALRESGTRDVA